MDFTEALRLLQAPQSPGPERLPFRNWSNVTSPQLHLQLKSPTRERIHFKLTTTEELLSTTLLSSLARGHKVDHSGAARVQRYPAPPAADPPGKAGHRAEPRRSCNYAILARRPQTSMGDSYLRATVRATAELLGTVRLGNTEC